MQKNAPPSRINTPTTTAKGTKPIFTLKSAVAEAYDMFPTFKDKVFFIDLDTNKVVHSDPAIRAQLIDALNNNDEIREMVNTEKFMAYMNKSSFCMDVQANGASIKFMALYLNEDMQHVFDSNTPLSPKRYSIFDHELAHAIIPEARAHKVKAESVADSYMALRHLQRYGVDSPLMESMVQRRAAIAFFNQDSDHFTSPALEKILEIKDKIDIAALSPAQTARLAARIGTQATPNDKEMQALTRQFNKMRGAISEVKDDQPLRDFADIVFRAKSPLMQKWGRVALSAFLDGDIHLRKSVDNDELRTIALRGKYWDDLRVEVVQP